MLCGRGVAAETKSLSLAVCILHPASYGIRSDHSFFSLSLCSKEKGGIFLSENYGSKNKGSKNNRREGHIKKTKMMTAAAMMTAISVVIGIFCKNYMNYGFPPGLFRVTFENLPIIMSGILYGPIIGGVVGVLTDLISYLLSSQTYPPNLIVTLGAAMSGIISGVVSRFIVRKKGRAQIIVSGALAHLVASMIIKPIGLYQFYGMLVLWRIPLYLCIAPVEILIICVLLNRKSFARVVGYVEENGHEL